MSDKKRLIDFICRFIPDDFECEHISVTFDINGDAFISLLNSDDNEDNYDDD